MESRTLLLLCTALCCLYIYVPVIAQGGVLVPRTAFTCQGRTSGYYADMETGCQVYHMCDGLGRQFSYTCPNTTLFQQRMLICDHWYMVNCSRSASNYDANLLIGQRDKPFVSDAEMQLRTPRPDILSVPPNQNFYEGLKEAESKFPIHPGNSIVGVADSLSSDNNGLDSGKINYRPPTKWSTGSSNPTARPNKPASNKFEDHDGEASHDSKPNFHPTPADQTVSDSGRLTNTGNSQTGPERTTERVRAPFNVPTPSTELRPPFSPSTESSNEFELDVRMKNDDPVFKFIKRFDPNSPDSFKTAMTKNQILDINQHLPAGQSSAEDERNPRKTKNVANSNSLTDGNKNFVPTSKFESANVKPNAKSGPVPERVLLPPKEGIAEGRSSTMGPPIYYEWKWGVPGVELETPLVNSSLSEQRSAGRAQESALPTTSPRSPWARATRPPADTPAPLLTEYNVSSYLVPDYVFPLDAAPERHYSDTRSSFDVPQDWYTQPGNGTPT